MKGCHDALIVMVKAPFPGRVKTRLVPPLTPGEASGLYRCFILDTLKSVGPLRGIDLHVAFTPPESKKEMLRLLPRKTPLFPQTGGDLGVRLERIFERFLSRGYRNVAVIGSDSPDLPPCLIEEAFSILRGGEERAVLGPALDGGYYLIAMNFFSSLPFRDILWSTDSVLDETVRRLEKGGFSISLLRPWRDVDTVEDLKILLQNNGAPLSRAFIFEHGIMERLSRGPQKSANPLVISPEK